LPINQNDNGNVPNGQRVSIRNLNTKNIEGVALGKPDPILVISPD
jgi:hypothetical protein